MLMALPEFFRPAGAPELFDHPLPTARTVGYSSAARYAGSAQACMTLPGQLTLSLRR